MNTLTQHSIRRSLILHLLPGALGTVAYVLCAPFFLARGYPPVLALLIAAGAIITPFQLGYLLWQAKRTTGSFSLSSVVDLREALPKWQYVVFPLGMVVWAAVVGGLSLVETSLVKAWYGWLPDWVYILDVEQLKPFSQDVLVITFWVGFVLNGFIGPIVEELYFRGHLLPRLPASGNWPPFINITLFSLYHFWTPWQFFSRLLSLLPWGYVVWQKRNIYLMMIAHYTVNILGWLLTWSQVLGKS